MTTDTKQGATRRIVDEHGAAEWLDLSVHTLRKDRREEMRIPFYRIGSAIRYDLDRVQAALASLEVGGSAPHRSPPPRKRRATVDAVAA
jgi:hypothetical protein